MSIKHVILGFLSEMPLAGYDLKRKFSDSEFFHWSGNSNQIYKALLELQEESLVTVEVQYQESKPPRKINTITDKGQAALHQWMLSTPELPQFRSALLTQLTWAEQVEPQALDSMLAAYEAELLEHFIMIREQVRREASRTAGSFSLAARAAEHWLAFYQLELDWVIELRQELNRSRE